MLRAPRALSTLAFLIILSSCAGAPKGAATAPASPFLWKVTAPGQPGTVHLLGTAHMRPDGERRLDRAITDAIEASDRVAVELDSRSVDAAATMAVVGELAILEGRTLGSVLDEELAAKAAATAERCGMKGLLESPFEPWFAAVAMAAACYEAKGFGGQSIDSLVLDYADRTEPPPETVELETVRSQLESMEMPADDVSSLVETIKGVDSDELSEIMDAYVANDVARLTAIRLEFLQRAADHPEYTSRFLSDRDAAFAKRAQGWLAEDRASIIAVGALHLVGEGGVVDLLREAGATVEPVAALGLGEPIALLEESETPLVGPGFEVLFPGEVEETLQDVPMGPLVMQTRLYTRRWGMFEELTLGVSTLPASLAEGGGEELTLAVLMGMAQAMGGEGAEPQAVDIAGVSGLRADVMGDPQAVLLAVLVHDGRMVQFIGAARAGDTNARERNRAAFERLLETFRFTDG